jgi:UDP-glucose 4-epimerase
METQTILVTGASGLLGSRVVRLLERSLPGARIIAACRNPDYVSDDRRVEVIRGDLRNKEFWASFPATITTVIHLAAFIPWRAEQKNDERVLPENLIPIEMLVEQSHSWPHLQQVIYSSSVSVYEPTASWLNESSTTRPASLYGAAKLKGEESLSGMKGIHVATLRFTSLYARGQYEGTVLPIMVNRARQGQEILIFGDGTRTQDFLHCEDAAHAVLLALQRNADGVYNIGAGTPVTMTELAETVSRVFSNGESKIVYQPQRADGDPGIRLDVSKARRELNYEPRISLECGLGKLKQELE